MLIIDIGEDYIVCQESLASFILSIKLISEIFVINGVCITITVFMEDSTSFTSSPVSKCTAKAGMARNLDSAHPALNHSSKDHKQAENGNIQVS